MRWRRSSRPSYLDGGLTAARNFIQRHIIGPAEDSLAGVLQSSEPISGAVGDYKSALQERLQAAGHSQPQYVLAAQSGPDHQKRFRIEVRVASADGVTLTLASAEEAQKTGPAGGSAPCLRQPQLQCAIASGRAKSEQAKVVR